MFKQIELETIDARKLYSYKLYDYEPRVYYDGLQVKFHVDREEDCVVFYGVRFENMGRADELIICTDPNDYYGTQITSFNPSNTFIRCNLTQGDYYLIIKTNRETFLRMMFRCGFYGEYLQPLDKWVLIGLDWLRIQPGIHITNTTTGVNIMSRPIPPMTTFYIKLVQSCNNFFFHPLVLREEDEDIGHALDLYARDQVFYKTSGHIAIDENGYPTETYYNFKDAKVDNKITTVPPIQVLDKEWHLFIRYDGAYVHDDGSTQGVGGGVCVFYVYSDNDSHQYKTSPTDYNLGDSIARVYISLDGVVQEQYSTYGRLVWVDYDYHRNAILLPLELKHWSGERYFIGVSRYNHLLDGYVFDGWYNRLDGSLISEFITDWVIDENPGQPGRQEAIAVFHKYTEADRFEWDTPKVSGQPFSLTAEEWNRFVDNARTLTGHFSDVGDYLTAYFYPYFRQHPVGMDWDYVYQGKQIQAVSTQVYGQITGGVYKTCWWAGSELLSQIGYGEPITADLLNGLRDKLNSIRRDAAQRL